jgi:hypothetical protein
MGSLRFQDREFQGCGVLLSHPGANLGQVDLQVHRATKTGYSSRTPVTRYPGNYIVSKVVQKLEPIDADA